MSPDSAPEKKCGPPRKRIRNWTDSMDLVMLALMKQQSAEGNFNNGIFSIKTWRKMTKSFNESTKKDFDVMHLKNRLKVLKRNFILFHCLANRSGWSWDNQNNVPVPRESIMWEEVITENTNYARLKDKPFPGYEDISFLFGKNTIAARQCDGTNKPKIKGQKVHKHSHPTLQWHTSAKHAAFIEDTFDNDVKVDLDTLKFNQDTHNKGLIGASTPPSVHTNLNGSSDQFTPDVPLGSPTTISPILASDSLSDACPPSSTGKRSRASSAAPTTSKKSKITTDVEQALVDLVEHGKKNLGLLEELLKREKLAMPTIYSMDDCWAKLQKIPNLSSEVKLAAVESFNDEFNRWTFMHCEGNMLESWLMRQLSKFYHTSFMPGCSSRVQSVGFGFNLMPPGSSHARHVPPSTGSGSTNSDPPKIGRHKIMELLIEEEEFAEKVTRTLITSGLIDDICGEHRNDIPYRHRSAHRSRGTSQEKKN